MRDAVIATALLMCAVGIVVGFALASAAGLIDQPLGTPSEEQQSP